jgi:hypothetical protein
MEGFCHRPQGRKGKAAERPEDGMDDFTESLRFPHGGIMARFTTVMSHVAELGVFFAAAAALTLGLMRLR